MTAWNTDLATAPTDKMILAKFSFDVVPVILKHATFEDGWSGWVWADEMLQEACDPLNTEECADVQWALIPE